MVGQTQIDIPSPKGINWKGEKGLGSQSCLKPTRTSSIRIWGLRIAFFDSTLYPLGSLGWWPCPINPEPLGLCPLKPRRWLHSLRLRRWPHLLELWRTLPYHQAWCSLGLWCQEQLLVSELPSRAFFTFLEWCTCLQLGRSTSFFPACGIPEVWEPSFISSCLCLPSMHAGNVSIDIIFPKTLLAS